jgi:FkbH-like protein
MTPVRKCIVWDLDNTIWDGVCLEGAVSLRSGVADAIKALDRRGILHSIASRGDEETAMGTLRGFGLDAYFLVPQVGWLPKSQSIVRISKELGLPLDSIAFVDDEPFEREQVAFMLPEVMTIDSRDADDLPGRPEFNPGSGTTESRERRRLYQAELGRRSEERQFDTREAFLRSCAMKLRIRTMGEDDVPRVLELMTRTHQLNTTGRHVEREELDRLLQDSTGSTRVFVAELEDRFGAYGCVGTAMVNVTGPALRLVYLAVSCRVMGRGIERSIVSWLARSGLEAGVRTFEAEYRDTGRNRMMRALYQMMELRERPGSGDVGTSLFSAPSDRIPGVSPWVQVT